MMLYGNCRFPKTLTSDSIRSITSNQLAYANRLAAGSFKFVLYGLLVLSLGCRPTSMPNPVPETTTALISVAAASDLKFAFEEIATEFRRRNPHIQIEPTFGSSGNFYTQLTNKAPFDLFLSADESYPQSLTEQGLGIRETQFRYAVGRIVVWVRNDSKIDIQQAGIQSLMDPSVHKIAIANPGHAPYGRAAEAAMTQLGILDSVQDKLVLGENISQTAQFVDTGAADIGIIALSLALAPPLNDKGRFWIVPDDAYPKLIQGGVIMSWAKDRVACDRLRSFLLSAEGIAILKRYGFETPDP